MLSNYGIGEDSWESLTQQWDQTNQSKGNQPLIFIGRTDAKDETPKLWSPDVKNWLIWKDPDSGKDWREEKGTTEDEMVEWHHRLNGHGFGWTPGVGDGQGGLACCRSWGPKELDTTEQLNWTKLNEWWWFSHYVVSNSCNPMDYSLLGFFVQGILLTRILE